MYRESSDAAASTGNTAFISIKPTTSSPSASGLRTPLLQEPPQSTTRSGSGVRASRLRSQRKASGPSERSKSTVLVEETKELPTESQGDSVPAKDQERVAANGNGNAVLAKDDAPLSPSLAVLVLGAVTIFWGAQHTAIKVALEGTDSLTAGVLNSLRFSLAALCFAYWLPPLPSSEEVEAESKVAMEWRGGAELGFWLFLGFFLQSLGLLFTTAQRSALLLYLNVKLVPFLGLVLLGQTISTSTWITAFVAFAGTFLVAGDGAGGVPLNIGDALSLGAACASAMFILRLEAFAPFTDSRALNSVTMLFVAAVSCAWTLIVAFQDAVVDPEAANIGPRLWDRASDLVRDHGALIFYLGVVTTAFTNWLQTIGQRAVPATVASAIYALDPLWGCLFAYLFLGEVLGPQGLLGCAVLLGVWLYQWISVSSWQDKDAPLPTDQDEGESP